MSYVEAIEIFLRACPGPPLALKGLRKLAFQPVRGIPGLEPVKKAAPRMAQPRMSRRYRKPLGTLETEQNPGGGGRLRYVKDVASALRCSPGHVGRLARRAGYSYGLAVRWVVFLLGVALHHEGFKRKTIAARLGFADGETWCRFSQRLVGKSPTELLGTSVEEWSRVGASRVFGSASRPRGFRRVAGQPAK